MINSNKKIIILCHCFLNCNSKVENFNDFSVDFKEKKKYIILELIKRDIGIIQLPCPEMHLYGCKRWGHVKDQFDTPHFRDMSKKLFQPILKELMDYKNNGFNIIGLLGVNGSPSCGVSLTCRGDWYGELSHNPDLKDMLCTLKMTSESGVFIEEVSTALKENDINIPIIGVDSANVNDILSLLNI